ncbi:MAG: nucleotidyltransferase domain-containing protein [Cyanobacteria bacterium P01_D01_bin.1]
MTLSKTTPDKFEQISPESWPLPRIQEVDGISAKIKQVLAEFKQALTALYGDRLVTLVLYGSFARGEEAEESDVDVLVVLTDMRSPFTEIQQMGDAKVALLLKYGELISVVPMMQDRFLHDESPLLRNVRKEGVVL